MKEGIAAVRCEPIASDGSRLATLLWLRTDKASSFQFRVRLRFRGTR